ncbi:MAG: pyruvate kinase [Phycisphaerae bacterium]|nr:pyruvate kinase [Phycisphaerae bacterium]
MASDIRFTKIVATVGPATEGMERLRALLDAGCNVIRLNASHGTPSWRTDVLARVRRAADEMHRHVAVLLDLCGPKIRVAALSADPLSLAAGDTVLIGRNSLPQGAVGFTSTYPAIVDDCRVNEAILLDDGAMRLTVTDIGPDALTCRVEVPGLLLPRKGINLPETAISSPSLTQKDLDDLAWGLAADVDYIGLSFVRRPEDISDLRRRIREAGSAARIIAKIEKPEAVADVERIIALSDAVMVARGDLGVEMDVAEVPLIQKRITRMAVRSATPVIIATQMLQTMIHQPYPTRAEVSDIANAILDGADAIMLSGETAVGAYPREAVAVMDRIANLTEDHEKEFGAPCPPAAPTPRPASSDDDRQPMPPLNRALADGAVRVATDVGAAAIVVLTHTGATALAVSKQRPGIPVFAVSDRLQTCRQATLYHGVIAIHHPDHIQTPDVRQRVTELLADGKWVEPGSTVVIISGQFPGTPGLSDILQVHRL